MSGAFNRRLGRGEVFLQQQAGGHELGAVVVEALGRYFRRKILCRVPDVNVQTEQVADGFLILHFVQATERRVSADPGELLASPGDVLGHGLDRGEAFRLAGLFLIFGRQLPQVELVDDLLPLLLLPKIFDGSGQGVEAAIGLLLVRSVALVAVLLEEGFGQLGRQRTRTEEPDEDNRDEM